MEFNGEASVEERKKERQTSLNVPRELIHKISTTIYIYIYIYKSEAKQKYFLRGNKLTPI